MTSLVLFDGVVGERRDLRLADVWGGFHFGAGLFSTLRVEGGEPLLLARHLARLRRGLVALPAVTPPPDHALDAIAVREAVHRALEAAHGRAESFTGVAKIVVADGHVLVHFRDLPPALEGEWAKGVGVETLEAGGYRHGDGLRNHKTLSYLAQYARLGRNVLFTNERDEVCEAPNANLFVRLGDKVVTPPLDAPCLAGVAREVLLEAFAGQGRPAEERPLRADELREATALALTNAVGLATPVVCVLGHARPESIAFARELRDEIRAASRDERH